MFLPHPGGVFILCTTVTSSVYDGNNQTIQKLSLCNNIYRIFSTFYLWCFHNIDTYTLMVRIIGTLGKYDQRRLWKLICIVNPFDLLFKKFTKI